MSARNAYGSSNWSSRILEPRSFVLAHFTTETRRGCFQKGQTEYTVWHISRRGRAVRSSLFNLLVSCGPATTQYTTLRGRHFSPKWLLHSLTLFVFSLWEIWRMERRTNYLLATSVCHPRYTTLQSIFPHLDHKLARARMCGQLGTVRYLGQSI